MLQGSGNSLKIKTKVRVLRELIKQNSPGTEKLDGIWKSFCTITTSYNEVTDPEKSLVMNKSLNLSLVLVIKSTAT